MGRACSPPGIPQVAKAPVGMTLLGALVPGSGYLYAGRRALGVTVLLAWLAVISVIAWYFGRDMRTSLDLAFDPALLKVAALVLGVGLVVWAFVVFTSYRLVRPDGSAEDGGT